MFYLGMTKCMVHQVKSPKRGDKRRNLPLPKKKKKRSRFLLQRIAHILISRRTSTISYQSTTTRTVATNSTSDNVKHGNHNKSCEDSGKLSENANDGIEESTTIRADAEPMSKTTHLPLEDSNASE